MVSLAQLFEGVQYSRDPEGSERDLGDFLRAVRPVLVDEEVCRVFGRERGRLRARKQLIGATALRHGLVLLTNNRRHFELIAGLRLISQ